MNRTGGQSNLKNNVNQNDFFFVLPKINSFKIAKIPYCN